MPSCLYESNEGTIIDMEDPVQNTDTKPVELTYEETPIIEPVLNRAPETYSDLAQQDDVKSVVPEATQVFGNQPSVESARVIPEGPALPPSKKSGKRHVGTILFVVLLFGLGVWLSSQLRSFFSPVISNEAIIPTLAPFANLSPSASPLASSSGTQPVSILAWRTMDIISGVTKKPIDGISYQFPNTVSVPVCDSPNCASQGANLEGGTRFTVAARGKGQLLPDFRGAILTDAGGREFIMKQTMIGRHYVYEYIGDFTGRTGGGYTFTKMRGVLVPVSDSLAIEFNHFSPAGGITDFEADDALFDEVIKTFKGSVPITPSPTIKPTVNLPSSTPIASSTGF